MKTAIPEAEGIAIVSLCSSDDKLKTYILSKFVEDHFGTYAARQIFQRVMTLIKNNKEIPSQGLLKVDPALPEEARAYLTSLQEAPVTCKEDADSLFELLEKYRAVRRVMVGTEQVVSHIRQMDDPDVDAMFTTLEDTLLEARSPHEEEAFVHSGDGDNTDELMTKLMSEEKPDLIRTGFETFDSGAGGFERTGLVVLSSVPGGGKSVMAVQLGVNMSMIGHSYCLVSLEMSKKQCFERYISSITQIPHDYIRRRTLTYDMKKKLFEAYRLHKEALAQNKCRFSIMVPQDEHSVPEYRMMLKPYSFDVIAFDYINLITDPQNHSGSHWEMLMHHSLDGKKMASALNNVVIMLAQLDEDTGKLRYSRAIKENANNWWWWNYGDKERETHLVDIGQGKARDNKTFQFTLLENFDCMSWIDPGLNKPATPQQHSAKARQSAPTMMGLNEDDNER